MGCEDVSALAARLEDNLKELEREPSPLAAERLQPATELQRRLQMSAHAGP